MAVPVFEKKFVQDIRQPVRVRRCGDLMFTGDSKADTIYVEVYNDGVPYEMSGTVTLNCIRVDGATVAVTGSISGNVAQATLAQACCAISGPLAVVMKITSGDVTSTILKAVYTVDVGVTGTTVDPGTIVNNVNTLIAAIESAVESIPADYSDLLAAIAPTYSNASTYAVGDYVWYDGDLYRCTTAISTAESWTAAHWDTAVFTEDVAGDVAELKSAVTALDNQFAGNVELTWQWIQGSYSDLSEDPPTTIGQYNVDKRIRTVITANVQTKLVLNCLTGYQYTYSLYVDNVRKEYKANAWITDAKSFEYGSGLYKLYLNLRKSDSSTIAPLDAKNGVSVMADNAVLNIYDAIAENKNNLDSIRTASASDAGKALKAKTIAEGKVTEWEFGSDVNVDDTLSISGMAADAKVTGYKISSVRDFLKEQFNGNAALVWEWKQGAYSDLSEDPPTNISASNVSLRIRTKISLTANSKMILHCKNGYQYTYSLYVGNTRKEYKSNAWINDDKSFEYGTGTYELYLNVKKSAGTDIIPSDAIDAIVVLADNALESVTNAINDINNRFGALNLFDRSANNTLRGYYSTSDIFTVSDELGQTDFIEVVEGVKYTSPVQDNSVNWYDANKDLLSHTGPSSFGSNGYVVAPTGAKYAKFIFKDFGQTSFYVCRYDGIQKELLPDRVPYGFDNQYKGLKAVAFGTSLSYRAQSSSGYLEFLPIMAQMDVDNQGIGNSTIKEHVSHTDMMGAITGYQSYADKDVVLVEGFVNDWYDNHAYLGTWKDDSNATVCGCVRIALNYILTQKPSATVIMILDHYGQLYNGINCSSTVEKSGKTQFEFYEEIAKVAESLGVPVIKGYALSGMSELTPAYYIDNIHPNMLGSKQFADVIWSNMKNIPIKAT